MTQVPQPRPVPLAQPRADVALSLPAGLCPRLSGPRGTLPPTSPGLPTGLCPRHPSLHLRCSNPHSSCWTSATRVPQPRPAPLAQSRACVALSLPPALGCPQVCILDAATPTPLVVAPVHAQALSGCHPMAEHPETRCTVAVHVDTAGASPPPHTHSPRLARDEACA